MKVLHVIASLEDGGAEAVLYRLVQSTPHLSHEVISLTGPGKYGPLLEAAGCEVHCLEMPRGRLTASGLRSLARLARISAAVVVQTWMYHADLVGGIAARFFGGKPVVWGVHTSDVSAASFSTRMVVRACAMLSRVVPDGIIYCSHRSVECHERIGYGARDVRVIPNGYDVSLFQRDPIARARLRQEWGVAEGEILLGFVARFDPFKDHETLIDALGRLSMDGLPFRCVLVGSGIHSDQTDLMRLLDRFNVTDKVVLAGRRSDIPQVMSALDLHVLTSRSEAFPNVLCEAMLAEVPCISTDVGDAALILDGLGWVTPPRRPDLISQAVHAASAEMQDVEGWRERGRKCRSSIIARYGVDRMAARYESFWRDTAAFRSSSSAEGI